MAKKFLTGLNLVVLDTDPATGSEGELYFNSSASVAKIYQAGAWSVLGAGGGATGALTGIDSISSPDFIQFDTTANVTPVTGLLGWDSVEGTLNLGLSSNKHIHVGEESVYRVRNSTGSTISKGTALYASGVEPSGRIQVTPYVADGSVREVRFMGLATENISDGVNGFVQHFGYVRDLDTRGTSSTAISVGDETWAAGDILYVHPTVPGKLTNIKPTHAVVVAIIIVRHQTTGILFVRPSSGGHLEDIHDILISGSVQNNQALVYNSSASVWNNASIVNSISGTANEINVSASVGNITIGIPDSPLFVTPNIGEATATSINGTIIPTSASIATTENLYDYLTTDDAILLYQPISVRLFNLTGLENVEGFLRTDGGLGWGVDTATYLTTSSASSTYLTQTDASNIYLTQTNAANTYLTPATSASIYQPLDQDLTAIAALSGSSGFLKKNIFNDWVIDSNTYLTTYDASTIYQTAGNYATIDGVETLTNKTMSSAFIGGTLTFNDIDYDHSISSASNNFTINAHQNLYLTTNTGEIVFQPDTFVKIYNEYVATQEWVNFQDYLTEASASTIYQPIGSYSTTSHNHTLDSLSNVVITGTPSDGQAIVWDTATSKWVNETVSGGGGASYPNQTGNDGKFLQTNSGSVSWQNVDFTGYLTESSASTTYLTQASASTTYLTTESDTLETVTDRGATSTNAITISNTTQSTTPTSGALIISGGVGIAKNVWIDGDLHVNGTTVTENTKTVATHDNLIYLNAAQDSTITNAVGDGTYVTYTADNDYTVGMDIRVTGMNPSGYNISSADGLTIYSATSTQFVVEKIDTGSFVSGGTAHAKEEANPDLGFAGGYYDAGYAHAGLFRDASDGVFKFFQGYTPEPDEAVNIDTTHASFSLAPISAAGLKLYERQESSYQDGGEDFFSYQEINHLHNLYNGVEYYRYALDNLTTSLPFYNITSTFGRTSNSNSVLIEEYNGYDSTHSYVLNSHSLSSTTIIRQKDNWTPAGGVGSLIGKVGIEMLDYQNITIYGTLNLENALSHTEGGTGLTTLGTAGQVLKVNSGATALEWGTVDALPSQSGNNGKYLTTDGSTASWGTLDLSLYLTLSSASTTYATILSPTLTTPNIGAATGTSLTTTGNVISHVDILTPTFVTNSYTLQIGDDGDLLMLNNSTTAGNLLIPTDASVNFPVGTQINIVQAGTGLITVAAVTPATTTVNATPGKKLRAQWSSAAIVKTAANTWLLMGDLTV